MTHRKRGGKDGLFFELLHAVHQLLTIVNNVKLKLDDFFRPGSQRQLSDEQRAEFIKALTSHLAFTTNKMLNTVPDLIEISTNQQSIHLRQFLLQEAHSLRDIVYTFAESAQKLDINEYINQQTMKQTSTELDEILSHMEQTIILLEKPNAEFKHMSEYISKLNNLSTQIESLVSSILQAQNIKQIQQEIDELKKSSRTCFDDIISSLKNDSQQIFSKRVQEMDIAIRKDLENIIIFIVNEVDVLTENLTHDPIYSEKRAQNVKEQTKASFFIVLCDIQQRLIGYKLFVTLKKQEVVEIEKTPRKANSLPHMEMSSIIGSDSEDSCPSPPTKPKKRRLFTYKRKKSRASHMSIKNVIRRIDSTMDFNHSSLHSTHHRSSNSNQNTPEPVRANSSSIPLTDSFTIVEKPEKLTALMTDSVLDMNNNNNSSYDNNDNTEDKQNHSSQSGNSNEQNEEILLKSKSNSQSDDTIKSSQNVKPIIPSLNRLKEEKPVMPRRSTSFVRDTKFNPEEGTTSTEFQAKRPKISRMISKSKIFKMEFKDIDTPERKLAKNLIKLLEDELPWFQEKFQQEHDTKIFNINSKIEELVKTDLVSYGNKIRSGNNSNKNSAVSTPRSIPTILTSSTDQKIRDLNQFVSSEVMSSESWKGLFSSTNVLLSPLEIPRVSIHSHK